MFLIRLVGSRQTLGQMWEAERGRHTEYRTNANWTIAKAFFLELWPSLAHTATGCPYVRLSSYLFLLSFAPFPFGQNSINTRKNGTWKARISIVAFIRKHRRNYNVSAFHLSELSTGQNLGAKNVACQHVSTVETRVIQERASVPVHADGPEIFVRTAVITSWQTLCFQARPWKNSPA